MKWIGETDAYCLTPRTDLRPKDYIRTVTLPCLILELFAICSFLHFELYPANNSEPETTRGISYKLCL